MMAKNDKGEKIEATKMLDLDTILFESEQQLREGLSRRVLPNG